jgi:hypothetical protein
MSRSQFDAARVELQAALDLLTEHDQASTLFATSLGMSLAQLDGYSEQHDRALAGYRRARDEYVARGGTAQNVLAATINIAESLMHLGRLTEALEELEARSFDFTALEPTPGRFTHYRLLMQARIEGKLEEWEGVRDHARQALELGASLVPGGHPFDYIARVSLAGAEAALGDTEGGLEVLDAGVSPAVAVYGPTSTEFLTLQTTAVELLVAAGRQEDADSRVGKTLAGLPEDTAPDLVNTWRRELALACSKGKKGQGSD